MLRVWSFIAAVGQQFGLPVQQLAAEILKLAFVHEGFVLGGTIIIR
jgi:hypothetical protein